MEACLRSPVGYPTSPAGVVEGGGGWWRRRGARLNQPVVPAPRPTCQHARDSCFLFRSLSPSLSASHSSITPRTSESLLAHLSPCLSPSPPRHHHHPTHLLSLHSGSLSHSAKQITLPCVRDPAPTPTIPPPRPPPSSPRHRKLLRKQRDGLKVYFLLCVREDKSSFACCLVAGLHSLALGWEGRWTRRNLPVP